MCSLSMPASVFKSFIDCVPHCSLVARIPITSPHRYSSSTSPHSPPMPPFLPFAAFSPPFLLIAYFPALIVCHLSSSFPHQPPPLLLHCVLSFFPPLPLPSLLLSIWAVTSPLLFLLNLLLPSSPSTTLPLLLLCLLSSVSLSVLLLRQIFHQFFRNQYIQVHR